MITFKQFLIEGGAATAKLGTSRANQADMKVALKFVSLCTSISMSTLIDQLLGSARLTFNGDQEDSGDVDIALDENILNRESIVDKMTSAVGSKPYITGGNIFSFAVPVHNKRKVQVDLMFVPDIPWAKFSHYADEHSAHKSGVRNELLHAVLKYSMVPGKDIRVKDEEGNDLVRASRAYKLDQGVERIFKILPKRKDGTGYVKSQVKASPEKVKAMLTNMGRDDAFSPEADIIRDPNKFAKLLFGARVKAKNLLSTEQLIKLIQKYRADDAEKIFKSAVNGIKLRKFKVPAELKQFEQDNK